MDRGGGGSNPGAGPAGMGLLGGGAGGAAAASGWDGEMGDWEEEIFLPDNLEHTFHDKDSTIVADKPLSFLQPGSCSCSTSESETNASCDGHTLNDSIMFVNTPPDNGLTILDILPWEDVLISRILPYLSVTDLFRLRQVSVGFRDVVAIHFSQRNHLDLSDVGPNFTADAFRVVTSGTMNLMVLKVPSCKKWIKDDILLPVIEANPQLREVDLSENSSLSTEVVRTLSLRCPRLQSLTLAECQQVSSTSVESIAMNCKKLLHLDLTGCWDMDDDTLGLVLQFHPHLTWLSVARAYGITNLMVDGICMFCPAIEYLDIQGCWRITDEAVRKLWNMKQLKSLKVRECPHITERSLARLRTRGIRIDILLPEESDLAKLERHLRAREFARIRSIPPNFVF